MEGWQLFLIILVVTITTTDSSSSTLTRIVQTRFGQLQGIIKPMGSGRHLRPIEVFLGVPYATPPTGGNRFSPTRTPLPWNGVRLADKMSPVCPQRLPDIANETLALERMPRGRLEYLRRLLPHLQNQSEDCLYMNIYAPAQGAVTGARYPVLLFIHGESFEWNAGNPYDGSVLASYADLVVVTINYRLGILGFLNANIAPQMKARVANYGLMDQIAALHWIQQNIALFHGDPGNVTLVGHGTGAACINFLIISPTVMPGLFHRAILLSGSAVSSWALVEDPVSFAVRLARQTNCSIPDDLYRDHEDIVDCLRDVPLQELMKADVTAPAFLSAFGPSVDGVVIKTDFQEDALSHFVSGAQKRGSDLVSRYDLLFGVVTSEALGKFSASDIQAGFEGERRDKIIRTYVRNAYTYHLSEIFFTVVNEYTDWERTVLHPINTRDATVAAISDAQFVAPVVQTGDLLSKPPATQAASDGEHTTHPRAFFYVFDYQTKDGDYPQRMGTVHGEELPYIFGAPLIDGFSHFPKNYTKSEVALSEAVILYISNFAKTGNPNDFQNKEAVLAGSKERNRFRSIVWDEYDPVHQKYLEIGMKPRMKNHYRAHQLSVWLRLIPELHRAGMEDVVARHNLFRNHNDNDLYDGVVRPDPLSRSGPVSAAAAAGDSRRRGNSAQNGTVAEIVLPVTTMETMVTTCISVTGSNQGYVNPHVANASDTLASFEAAGYAAYSTALSVTIAIGCSLLVLNILIFAGVYYQRDKTRLEVKSMQQQQQRDISFESTTSKHFHHATSASVIVDVEHDTSTMILTGGGTLPRSSSSPSSHLATLPRNHVTPSKPMQQQQLRPDLGAATLPRNLALLNTMDMPGVGAPPNGSATLHMSLPRPPPPPRSKSPPESQPLLTGHHHLQNNPTLQQQHTKSNLRVPQAAMSEMRV
ncbi:LOW QUALITY PROTEIN: neuroligin-4, Y-linked-like [Nilaparvata lugens]|uniref:LOW QUALITY PROTEIN: neuroligin-4, Y-linked-like n=1 Tax=Nilaparvata lugens TaxID=108931 RepID=UPI00193C8BB5|nr:LOW QUALITY PROTEIN: neuroligin-4, Y-linked-like [Nilaparvata lugens]